MIQIISRKDGKKSKKTNINSAIKNIQVSYNSWGHLVVRILQNENPNEDTLIVFNQRVSGEIIDFSRNNIRDIIRGKTGNIDFDDLPF